MLGGFPQISRIDLRGSATFLAKLRKTYPPSSSGSSNSAALTVLPRAVDCGAGIGRITAGFLSKVASRIDIVEPISSFATTASKAKLDGSGTIGDVYIARLQEWTPEVDYDLYWFQWCLGHLTDAEVVFLLQRCRRRLKPGGWVVVKENTLRREEADVFDTVDSSVTRGNGKWRSLMKEAGCTIVWTEVQGGFPRDLYPVRFYALRPKEEELGKAAAG
jgi:protein N-terminal methyltransferase